MKKIWVNGVFDILHVGHIKLFEFAKSQGDYLKVGIDNDERVKCLKGIKRPINSVEDRKKILESIKYIDEVVNFCSDEELILLIKQYNPDILVIGSDYKNKSVIGGEYAHEIIYFDKIKEYSSTIIINKILDDHTK